MVTWGYLDGLRNLHVLKILKEKKNTPAASPLLTLPRPSAQTAPASEALPRALSALPLATKVDWGATTPPRGHRAIFQNAGPAHNMRQFSAYHQ